MVTGVDSAEQFYAPARRRLLGRGAATAGCRIFVTEFSRHPCCTVDKTRTRIIAIARNIHYTHSTNDYTVGFDESELHSWILWAFSYSRVFCCTSKHDFQNQEFISVNRTQLTPVLAYLVPS